MISKITENIFIGNADDAKSAPHITEAGITAVLNCAMDLDYQQRAAFTVKVGMIDGKGNKPTDLLTAVRMLETLLENGHRVLVHCHEGRSRSPVVVATYMSKTKGMSIETALSELNKLRPLVDPNQHMIKLAKDALGI